jgi:hypothetical protein
MMFRQLFLRSYGLAALILLFEYGGYRWGSM